LIFQRVFQLETFPVPVTDEPVAELVEALEKQIQWVTERNTERSRSGVEVPKTKAQTFVIAISPQAEKQSHFGIVF
jgi:hypothetical protein